MVCTEKAVFIPKYFYSPEHKQEAERHRCMQDLRCKVFYWYNHNPEGFADIVKLIKSGKIKVEKTFLADKKGRRLYSILLDIPCSALALKNGKHCCKLYGKKARYKMCDEFPYNVTDWEKRYRKGIAR